MSGVSLRGSLGESRLLVIQSMMSRVVTLCWTPVWDSCTLVLPTWELEWGLLFILTCPVGPRKVFHPWRKGVKHSLSNPVVPEESLVARPVSHMTSQTNIVWATPRFSWCKPWLMVSTLCTSRTCSSRRSMASNKCLAGKKALIWFFSHNICFSEIPFCVAEKKSLNIIKNSSLYYDFSWSCAWFRDGEIFNLDALMTDSHDSAEAQAIK